MVPGVPDSLDHPALRAGAAVFVGYGVVLAVVLLALFVLPYAAFVALG